MSEVGRFFKIFKIQNFRCFITQLRKNIQQQSLYIMFILNAKRPLKDIWLLSYKQKSVEYF